MKEREAKELEACISYKHLVSPVVEILQQLWGGNRLHFIGPFRFWKVTLLPLLEQEKGLVSKMTFSASLKLSLLLRLTADISSLGI